MFIQVLRTDLRLNKSCPLLVCIVENLQNFKKQANEPIIFERTKSYCLFWTHDDKTTRKPWTAQKLTWTLLKYKCAEGADLPISVYLFNHQLPYPTLPDLTLPKNANK